MFPREALVRDNGARQPELGVGQQHQPSPAVRLLRVTHARSCPGEGLLAEAEGMLLVKLPDIGPTEQRQIGDAIAWPLPPQPELLGLAGLAPQSLHLDEHQRAADGYSPK